MSEGFERAWLESVLARYEQPLLRFAAQIVGRDRARDVVQDTFLALCKADRDQVELRLAPWLFVVCRNRALDLLREQRRLSQLDEAAGVTSLESGRSGDGVEARQTLAA